jgi:lipopolysaccharide/colanic/teichoic acid biosynthesis glycosyltransferase
VSANQLVIAKEIDNTPITAIATSSDGGQQDSRRTERINGHKDGLDENRVLEATWLRSSLHMRLGQVLTKLPFLKVVQSEKLRSDRSKAPLSVAIFDTGSNQSAVAELVHVVLSCKRETDVVGCLSDSEVALLLPYTDADGAQRFAAKITELTGAVPLSSRTLTHPDQLINNLMIGKEVSADAPSVSLNEDLYPAQKEYFLKRALDIVGASCAIAILSPLLLCIATTVATTSRGPIVFRQIRLGKGGKPFVFYKFRSMYQNSDDRIHREYVTSLINGELGEINQGDSGNPMYKLRHDPRVTPVGRILRKSSLDELPQLFNVLKGDMSLVGPRPPVGYEVEKYQPWHLRRILEVRPGITGKWQVEGRSKTSFDDMVRLDLQYIRNCSLLLDLKLLIKTIKVVLKSDGAA